MKLTQSRRLCGLGVVILAALLVCSRSPSGTGGPAFLAPLLVAGVAYLLAAREMFQSPGYPRRVVFACLALAALWRVPFLLKSPASEDDIRRYVWDGRLQRLGYNPYTAIPEDPALAALHTTETRGLNNPDVPSPYPPGAQLFFRTVTAIRESVFAFKVAFLACDVLIILVLLGTLRATSQTEHWVLLYAWHPLVATDMAGSGHVDILGVLLLLVSVSALKRRWRTAAAITFGLAIAVKFLPAVLAPLYWRRIRIRDAVLAALVVAMLYLPFLERGRIPIGSLGAVVQRFRFNDPIFASMEHIAGAHFAAALALFAGLAAAAWLRIKQRECSWNTWPWPMAASVVCAPVVYPWYLLWLIPFFRGLSTMPLLVWSITILPTYFVWHLHSLGQRWQVPPWLGIVEYLPVVAAAVLVLRSAGPSPSDATRD